MATLRSIYDALSATRLLLERATSEFGELALDPARLDHALAEIGALQDELSRQHPELAAPDSQPDLAPTDAALAYVGALAPSDLDDIDRALVAATTPRFRKVAFVVATAMIQLAHQLPALPDVFYARRILRLVALGQLDAQGDLQRMRFSEVRRPR